MRWSVSSLGLYEPSVTAEERDRRREEATAEVLAACNRAGIVAGIITPNGEGARRRVEQGFRLVGVTSDLSLILEGGIAELARARGEG